MSPNHLIFFGFLAALGGCSHRVYSPPARFAPLQGPEAIGETTTAVAGELATQGDIFGPRLLGFAVRARHGLTPEVEVQGEATVIHVDDSEAADTDQSPVIGAGRVGAKWSIAALGNHLALSGGVGGGGHTGGAFAAADLGFTAGFQNRYAVPFYTFEGGVSLPINASAVDTSREDEELGTHLDTPITTFSLRSAMGVRVPFTLGWGRPGALALGVQHIWLIDTDGEDSAWAGPAAHFEAAF